MIVVDLALNANTPVAKAKVGYNPATPNEEWDAKNPEISSSSSPYKLYNIGNNAPLPLMSFIETIEDGDVLSSSKNVEGIINNINYKSNSNLINRFENNEAV